MSFSMLFVSPIVTKLTKYAEPVLSFIQASIYIAPSMSHVLFKALEI